MVAYFNCLLQRGSVQWNIRIERQHRNSARLPLAPFFPVFVGSLHQFVTPEHLLLSSLILRNIHS